MATSGGLNLGPGITRNPDGSFSYNGKPIATGSLPPGTRPGMTYSPVNTSVPTFGIPGVGTPGAPSAPGGAPTNNFGPDLTNPGSSSSGFESWLKAHWKDVAKALGLAVTSYEAFKAATSNTGAPGSTPGGSGTPSNINDLTSAMTDIAKQQAARATELFNSATPLRTAGTAALQQRLGAGPRATPDLSGLVDNANPFRKNFAKPSALDAAASAIGPAVPPPAAPGAAPAPPPGSPLANIVKDRVQRAWSTLR